MSKFKQGDRVKLIGERRFSFPKAAEIGMVGTVIDPKPSKGRDYIAIDLDGIPRNHGFLGEGWWFSPSALELIET